MVPAVAPHALYTNDRTSLAAAAALARKYGVPIVIHFAETEDDNRLLTYWIIFGLVYSLDELFRSVLGFIPGYHLLRFAAMIALFRQNFSGAKTVYVQFVRPLFNKYAAQIDALIEPIEERSRTVSDQFKKKQ